ncbi:hypothetical protein BKA57DRAFT_461130 [Linnemannia elongata]|nr:hypothetical protein BKA57DRAFT_461130 [Linnemannia elongata]
MSKRSFVPNCMTSDGTTFYAHATFSLGSGNTGRTIVIAKSNANPASFSDVTWSVYATASEADMATYLQGMNILKSMLCSVDKQGVFTIIATSTKTSMNSLETLGMGGYQYTPHADPTTGGTWTTILIKDPYPWSSVRSGGLVSVPAATAGGKDTLMHVFPTSSSGDTIGVGVFDPFTKSFSLQSNWTLPSPGHPYVIEPRGDQMNVLTYNIIGGKSPVLSKMSISPTAVQPANASITASNFTVPEGCTSIIADRPQTLLFANTFYYMCRYNSNANYLVSTNGTNTIGPLKTTVFGTYYDLYPIGPPEGPPRWAMMTNFSDYAGVILSGDRIGEFQTTPTRMILTGLPGDGNVLDGGDSGSGVGGSGISPGAIGGIVGGVIFLIVSISSICRICTKRSKRHLGFSRPTTPVYEDPDSLVPNIADVPEAKMECDALPMAPISTMPPVSLGTTGTGTGVGLGKDSGSSVLPPPLLAPRPLTDTKVSQAAQVQQQSSPQAPQTQNTYEDGYQQGFQQALLALRNEQEQQRQQEHQRQAQNPQLFTTTAPTAWSPANSGTATVTSNNPQYYSQANNPQYYPLPVPGSISYQQQQQQHLQDYYQIGVTTDDPRNPQSYNTGAPLSPVVPGSTPVSTLPAYVPGMVGMTPAPSYGNSSVGTPYTPSSGAPQVWTPGPTAYTPPVVPGYNYHPDNQGPNPSYHQ